MTEQSIPIGSQKCYQTVTVAMIGSRVCHVIENAGCGDLTKMTAGRHPLKVTNGAFSYEPQHSRGYVSA